MDSEGGAGKSQGVQYAGLRCVRDALAGRIMASARSLGERDICTGVKLTLHGSVSLSTFSAENPTSSIIGSNMCGYQD